MTLPPKTICWIHRGTGEIQSKRFEKICRGLADSGYALLWLECTSADGDASPEWIAEKLPASLTAIFFSDLEAPWTASLVRCLKNCSEAHVAGAPTFWLYDAPSQLGNPRLADLGVDDYFAESLEIHELLVRLELRCHKTEEFTRVLRELHEQSVKIATTETMLKQREEFLGVCAHDLRSPLGLIQSSLSMILNAELPRNTLSQLYLELLTRAKRQAGQALGLVNDLLDVMAFEQGLKPRFELLRMHEFLEEIYLDYRFQGEQRGVELHYENRVPEWRVFADSDRLRQLMQNLLVNALKFTDRGKNIFITVRSFTGKRKVDPPFPMLLISVRDEGRGIPKKEIEKIFDRFTQMKDYSRAEGRGLGLTVAKQISALHGGNVWVESEEGKGSTFHVVLPHVISKPIVSPAKTTKKTVLVVEPSSAKRAEFFERVSSWGYQVTFASDGIEALTYLYYLMPDVIVLTPNLSKMDEADVANQIKGDSATSFIPLIMAVDRRLALKRSLDGVLCDQTIDLPFSQEIFQGAIEKARKGFPKRPKKAA